MLQQQKQILAGDVLGEQTFAQNLGREDFEFCWAWKTAE